MYNEKLGRVGALSVFIGFNVTFFPQFVLGSRGMPRRYYNYLPEFQSLHQLSTIGAYTLGLGFLLTAFYLFSLAAQEEQRRAQQPLGWRDARVADGFAASLLQLPPGSGSHSGSVRRLREPRVRREDQGLPAQDGGLR